MRQRTVVEKDIKKSFLLLTLAKTLTNFHPYLSDFPQNVRKYVNLLIYLVFGAVSYFLAFLECMTGLKMVAFLGKSSFFEF